MALIAGSSSIIIALGKTIVHSLWMGLLVLIFLKIAFSVIPARYSIIRYRLAALAMFLFLGACIWLFSWLYVPEPHQRMASVLPVESGMILPVLKDLADHGGHSYTFFFVILSYLYLAGMIFMMLRYGLSYLKIRRIRQTCVPVQGAWAPRFNQIRKRIGIKWNVGFMESERISVPALIGYLKPLVIVPAGMLSHLSVAQVETILMHELYHLRRLDYLVNLLQLCMEGIFFYNPAVWNLSQLIRIEREHCCDDLVLKSCVDPLVYARALLNLSQYTLSFTRLVPGATGNNQYQLLNRMRRILNPTTMRTTMKDKLFTILLMAAGLIILITVTGFRSGFSIHRINDSFPREPDYKPSSVAVPARMEIPGQDTIPFKKPENPEQEGAAELEAREALGTIDWDELKKEIEAAKAEALEDIDWDELEKEIEAAKAEALEDIDWDELEKEIEAAELEASEALEAIDWDEIKKEIESVEWEEIRKEMEQVGILLDSVLNDLVFPVEGEYDLPQHGPEAVN